MILDQMVEFLHFHIGWFGVALIYIFILALIYKVGEWCNEK